jgi:hypothetical protein
MDSKGDRRIAGLLAIGATVLACGASAVSFPAHLSFQPSMHAGTSDADGKPIVGTEIMHLVPHQGRLYAGNSLWMENDPQVPKTCQILVLDSPYGPWKVDHQFTRRNLRLAALRSFTLTTDGSGKAIRPVPMLLAAPDVTVHGTVQIFSRDDTTGTWVPMNFAEASKYRTTRALGLHRDKTTGVDRIFAGNDQLGIFSGVYDSRAAGHIRWEQTAELAVPSGERVMGFCNCNGVLFCATTCNIFMRSDGHSPSWKRVYSRPEEIAPVGIRGLTAVPNPSGRGEVLLFAALSKIRRLDPSADFQESIELDMRTFLAGILGIRVSFVLAAYNDFVPYLLPGSKETVWLVGFECTFPPAVIESSPSPKPRVFFVEEKHMYFAAEARYFIRHASRGNIHYEVAEVADSKKPTLVSVRAIAVSPFAGDRGEALYFAGFDCNYQPSHNTGWVYRGQFSYR